MAPQYAYPDADTSPGDWGASTGSDRYAMIDDAHGVADAVADNTYIQVSPSGDPTAAHPITVSLGSTTDPVSGADHSVVILWSDAEGMQQVSLNVNLKDSDGSSIKNENFDIDEEQTGPITSTMSLSTAQANSISSSGYGNLGLVLTSTDNGGSATVNVYRAYFKCPEAGGSSVPIAAIAMNTYKQMGNN
jgi:hypothetical protein